MNNIKSFIQKNKAKIYCDLSTESFDDSPNNKDKEIVDGDNCLMFKIQFYPVFDYSHNLRTLMDVSFEINNAEFWTNGDKMSELSSSEIEFLKPYIYE